MEEKELLKAQEEISTGYKSLYQKIRKTYYDVMYGRKTIDRLMRDKVEDYILTEELPISINIKGDTVIYIGNFTFNNEWTFYDKMSKLFGALSGMIVNDTIADDRKKELIDRIDFDLLAKGDWMLEFLYRYKKLYKKLVKLIGKIIIKQQVYYMPEDKSARKRIKWKNCSLRYFIKNMTKEKLLQICKLIHLYNFDAVKKNIKILVGGMGINQSTETYMYTWLKDSAGVNGKFLQSQAPSIDSVFKDKGKETTPLKSKG
jgi:hypothetical protein